MNELQLFQYEGKSVRTVFIGDEPMFIAKDVCEVLGISKYRDAVSRLDEDEGCPVWVDTLGGKQEMIAVTEAGLFNLIIRSDKPQAKQFKRWITHDVLPSIRKTGKYEIQPLSEIEVAKRWVAALEDKVRLEAQLIEQKPKVEFFDQAMSSNDTLSMKEAAKILGYGPNKLFTFLVSNKILFKSRGFYLPYQEQLEADRFKVIETPWPKGEEVHIYRRTAVTQKGLDYIRRRIAEAA